MGKDSIMADQINSVSINDLPVSENCELSDRIRVYTLSGKTYVPGTMKISDLSNFIFTGAEMENLKNKYESLEKTWDDFQTWLRTNFVSRKEVPGTIKMPVLSNIVSTSAYALCCMSGLHSQRTDMLRREMECLPSYFSLSSALKSVK